MRSLAPCPLASALAVLVLCLAPPGRGHDKETARDDMEQLLLESGLKTDSASLLAYLRRRTLFPEDQDRLRAAVERLGDASFFLREKASADLIAAGRSAVPYLRPALPDPDLERAQRASRCLETIEHGPGPLESEAVLRLLAARQPPGAFGVVWDFVPFADDDDAQQQAFVTLAVLAGHEGKAMAAVTAALSDRDPVRRAAAAFVVGEAGAEKSTPALCKLLADQDALVRFHAARALLKDGHKEAVAVLTRLLDDAPYPIAGHAETILCRLARGQAPDVALQVTGAGRHQCRQAWEAWWKDHATRFDFSHIDPGDPWRGLIVVADLDSGCVLGLDASFKECWRIEDCEGVVYAQLLPSGRILLAENHAQRVTERARSGKILWEKKIASLPLACRRLPDGNTFIAARDDLLVVGPGGGVVWSRRLAEPAFCIRLLRDGNLVLLTTEAPWAFSAARLCRLSAAGQELGNLELTVRFAPWPTLTVLPNGHYLLARDYEQHSVFEIDRKGRAVRIPAVVASTEWTCADRLPNGHTLFGDGKGRRLVEVDRDGKFLRERKLQGRPWFVAVAR
jgi:hypothetical protein